MIKELAPIVDGRGGGKPDMAMAGGSNQAKIQELLDAVAGKLIIGGEVEVQPLFKKQIQLERL